MEGNAAPDRESKERSTSSAPDRRGRRSPRLRPGFHPCSAFPDTEKRIRNSVPRWQSETPDDGVRSALPPGLQKESRIRRFGQGKPFWREPLRQASVRWTSETPE